MKKLLIIITAVVFNQQCYSMQNPQRRKFTPQEDEVIIQFFEENQGKKGLSRNFPLLDGRNFRQCRDRWNYYLKPGLDTSPLTKEELLLLNEKVIELGKNWAKISAFFKGRSSVYLKNSFNNRLKIRPDICKMLPDIHKVHPDIYKARYNAYKICLDVYNLDINYKGNKINFKEPDISKKCESCDFSLDFSLEDQNIWDIYEENRFEERDYSSFNEKTVFDFDFTIDEIMKNKDEKFIN